MIGSLDVRAFGLGPVALDTAVFIYLLEENRAFLPLVMPIFEAIDAGRLVAVTSAVTLLEVLVVPMRNGDTALAERYEVLLTQSRGLHLVDIDRSLLRAAAALRAKTSMKTPDALQVAAGLRFGAKAFVTGDRDIPTVGELAVIRLSPDTGRAGH